MIWNDCHQSVGLFSEIAKTAFGIRRAEPSLKEKKILNLLVKGNSYKEIAGMIFISVETINSHIKNIYRKVNGHSRAELAAHFGNSL